MKKLALMITALLMLCISASAEGLGIVCTDFPCYDFARQVAGEGADITMLLKPGTEAHAYDPTPTDIMAIGEADLFVYIGGESDAWTDGILASFADGEGPRTLRMMAVVNELIEEEDDAHHHEDAVPEYDEHIWTAPLNAAAMVDAMGHALSEIDPANAGIYRDNAARYADEIRAIDEEARAIVDHAARRTLVFADRYPFAYFAKAYGLDVLAAFSSCTADTEPSAQTLMALIDRVIDEGIPAVYTIELSTRAVAKTVAEETGAEILTMQSMQTLTQEDFDAGATYVSIMRDNLKALEKGLN